MGCSLTDIIAAFIAVAHKNESNNGGFLAASSATAYAGMAGEVAALHARGPGSFAVAYLDCLASIGEKECMGIKYEEIS